MRSLTNVEVLTVLGLTLGALALPVRAQQYVAPVLRWKGQTDSTLPVTASDAYGNIQDVWNDAALAIPLERFDYPRDSIRAVASAGARRWLMRMAGTREDVRQEEGGVQAESYVRVLAAADEDTLAERAITARLATPGLTAAERSYTYLVAIEAFADPSVPRRLPIAERYLGKLNAMGMAVAPRRLDAELVLVRAYDELGQPSDVARHGIAAIHLVPDLALKDVFDTELYFAGASAYPTIVRAVAIQPNGKAAIAEMNRILTARLAAPPDSVALDSTFFYYVDANRQSWADLSKSLARIGELGGVIPSNHWLNMPDTGVGTMQTNDGRVRVVLTMTYQCPACVVAAMHLESIADADPKMQAVLVTWTEDENYGNRVVTPEENEVWQEHFWEEKHIHYPIALWIARLTDTVPDGSIDMSLRDDSAYAHYPETGKPVFYILDGRGRIRAYFDTETRVIDHQIAAIVRRLEQEALTPSTATVSGQ